MRRSLRESQRPVELVQVEVVPEPTKPKAANPLMTVLGVMGIGIILLLGLFLLLALNHARVITNEQVAALVVMALAGGAIAVAFRAYIRNLSDPNPKRSSLFHTGPGVWRANWVYWFYWVVGVCTIPFFGIGFGIFIYLIIAANNSKADWRNEELQRAIRESK